MKFKKKKSMTCPNTVNFYKPKFLPNSCDVGGINQFGTSHHPIVDLFSYNNMLQDFYVMVF